MADSALELNEKFTVYDDLNDEKVELEVDPKTRGQVTIDIEHHMSHLGKLFTWMKTKNVPNAGTFSLGFWTPAYSTRKEIHFRFQVSVEAEALVELYENPDSWSGGTYLKANCTNRILDSLEPINIYYDPTISIGAGLRLYDEHLGSGIQVGGALDHEHEKVLKFEKAYILRITNLTAVDNYMTMSALFYSHIPYFGDDFNA